MEIPFPPLYRLILVPTLIPESELISQPLGVAHVAQANPHLVNVRFLPGGTFVFHERDIECSGDDRLGHVTFSCRLTGSDFSFRGQFPDIELPDGSVTLEYAGSADRFTCAATHKSSGEAASLTLQASGFHVRCTPAPTGQCRVGTHLLGLACELGLELPPDALDRLSAGPDVEIPDEHEAFGQMRKAAGLYRSALQRLAGTALPHLNTLTRGLYYFP